MNACRHSRMADRLSAAVGEGERLWTHSGWLGRRSRGGDGVYLFRFGRRNWPRLPGTMCDGKSQSCRPSSEGSPAGGTTYANVKSSDGKGLKGGAGASPAGVCDAPSPALTNDSHTPRRDTGPRRRGTCKIQIPRANRSLPSCDYSCSHIVSPCLHDRDGRVYRKGRGECTATYSLTAPHGLLLMLYGSVCE